MDGSASNPFRNANLRILGLVAAEPPLEHVPFVCECDNPACFETVYLSVAEFEQIRLEGGYATLRGHPVGDPAAHSRRR